MLQLLICWKHITHTYEKKTNYSYCVGALRAFLRSPASRHPPETRCLLSSDYSHLLPLIINPSFRPAPSLSLSVYSRPLHLPRSSLRLFRQDLSSSVKLQSAHHSAGCLEKADNDKPNPADLQLIALFHQPSTIILCPQTPPLLHLWLRHFDHRLPIFSQQGHRCSIINAYFHLCHGCLATQCLQSLWLPPPVSHLSSLLRVASHTAC